MNIKDLVTVYTLHKSNETVYTVQISVQNGTIGIQKLVRYVTAINVRVFWLRRNAKKNIISDTINKIIPNLKPNCTFELC